MVFLLFFQIVVICFVLKGVVIVPQQHVMVVETMGKYSKTLRAGINFVVPFLEKTRSVEIVQKEKRPNGQTKSIIVSSKVVDMREIVYDFDLKNARTKDEQYISVKVLLSYQVVDPVKAVYSVKNLPESLEKLANITLMNILSEKFLSDALASSESISEDLLSILEKEITQWGVQLKHLKIHEVIER